MNTKMEVKDHFSGGVNIHWNKLSSGGGFVEMRESVVRMGFDEADNTHYSDAQVDDYTMLSRRNYLWKAPLRMSVKARFVFSDGKNNESGSFQGTAGFGFWNNPFTFDGGIHALPEAIWFFYASSRSQMVLINSGKGNGWKTQVIHSVKWENLINFIPTATAVLLAKLTKITSYALYWIERFSGVEETILKQNMDSWHTYEIEWKKKDAIFYVDGVKVMVAKKPPLQPLGFVAWVDNQYSVVIPQGSVRFGTSDSKGLVLEIDSISIESM